MSPFPDEPLDGLEGASAQLVGYPYATPQDMIARYPSIRLAELTNLNGEEIREDRIQSALEDAAAEMDVYLARRYALPLEITVLPPVLTRVSCDIAMYRLMSFLDRETVSDVRKRYLDAVEWMEGLAAGRVQLSALDGSELKGATDQLIAATSPRRRVFGRQGLAGWDL